MTKCSFCGKDESPHLGVHLIRNSGHVDFYCSSKCRKNALKLHRDKKKLKWTTFFYETREKAKALEAKQAEKAKEAQKEKEHKAEKKPVKNANKKNDKGKEA
jgi:large subunit ribosomal protein L24e